MEDRNSTKINSENLTDYQGKVKEKEKEEKKAGVPVGSGDGNSTEPGISGHLDDLKSLKEELALVKEELDKARKSSDANLNKLKYMMADFDNYRKQMERQVASRIESGRAELLLKFLNIHDDFIRALGIARQSKTERVVIEGLEGILKNLDTLFKSEGIVEIEALNTPFDPNIHDAISFSMRDDLPENTVTSEIRKGYMLNNKVLRPSLVEISKKIVKNSVTDTERGEEEAKD